MLIILICTLSIDTHMHWCGQRAAPRQTALMWQQTASLDTSTWGPSMLPPSPPRSFIYSTFEDFLFNCAASAQHETSAVCSTVISLSPHLTSQKSLNIFFPSCIQISINVTKEPPPPRHVSTSIQGWWKMSVPTVEAREVPPLKQGCVERG